MLACPIGRAVYLNAHERWWLHDLRRGEPACAAEARRFLAGRAPQHALAKLLIRCHEAISDGWDADHEDTRALLDEIDETLRSLPAPEGSDPI